MAANNATAKEDKSFMICSVLGGLDITRLVSSNTRSFFGGAIEDVELIREFVSVSAQNQGIVGGLSDLIQISQTLDWEARGFPNGTTTVLAGLGVVDDSENRTIERYVSLSPTQPLVGDKQTDMKILNSVTLIFPWIVDRKSIESRWWTPHLNGRSEGSTKEPFLFDSLYTAAWIGTYGEVWAYYPPLRVYEQPLTFGDVLGGSYDSHEEEFVKPNLPGGGNLDRKTFFTKPYPDSAVPGLSLITALAPIYLTGTFGEYTFNDTYLASTGLDIAVASVSTLLDALEDKLTALSFGILVDSNFNIIVISESVVMKVYPERTGFEETRVTYDLADGSIVQDRRNQTYQVSDTILQPLTNLTNANWVGLLDNMRKVVPGDRGFDTLNITITGDASPTSFYVMFERWEHVADWNLLVFAPVVHVDDAVDIHIYNNEDREREGGIFLEGTIGSVLGGEAVIVNSGTLDVIVAPKSIPRWILLEDKFNSGLGIEVAAGESLPVSFNVLTSELAFGSSSGVMTFNVQDDNYPDCFHNGDLSLELTMRTTAPDCGSSRTADASGHCVCDSRYASIGEDCVSYALLVSAIVIPIIVGIVVIVYMYVEHKRKQSESVWAVKPSELRFDDPPVTVGRGTFGLVLLAEYRGTKVAVKRVIPPRDVSNDGKGSGKHSGVSSLGSLTEGRLARRNSVLGRIEAETVSGPPPGKAKRRLSAGFDFSEDEYPQYSGKNDSFRVSTVEQTEQTVHKKPSHALGGRTAATYMDSVNTGGHSGSGNGLILPLHQPTDSLRLASMALPKGMRLTGLSGSGSLSNVKLTKSSKVWSKILGYRDEYAQLKADFVREMRLLSKLRHPCITTVMGAVIERGEDPMLVMEYMDHGSLYDVLHNETMVIEGELVLPILRDIAQGLRFLHAASPQVIHGDLKAQNVLVDIKFRAKVADFGLSQKKKVGATGTPLWMAPELLRGDSENTAASDVYSFGVVLYEVYSRKDPYEGEDHMQVLKDICNPDVIKRLPVPEAMPPAMVSLMCDCLVPDPDRRPTFHEIDNRLQRLNIESIEPGATSISRQQNAKNREAEKNLNLLLEVFPKHIAEALRDGRKVEPEHHDCVTIFFSDIVGFTTISGSMPPLKVADMLDRLYLAFDYLSEEHNVFKVETIGDAWMGVTNLVEYQPDHAKRIAEFAIDAIEAAGKTLIDLENPAMGFVQIRVGFHSGPVLSNVVGSRNPKFTIFGDTVNTSSRMESNSSPGRILCSERAADLLSRQSDMHIVYRGEIPVKGKGNMKTYWVGGL